MQEHLPLQSSVHLFDIAFNIVFTKKFIFLVHFLCVFWHGTETFPKGSSQYKIVPLLVVFDLPYNKYKGVKICFYQCRYQKQNIHSCCTRVVRLALVSHLCCLCLTRVALVLQFCTRVAFLSLVSHSCRSGLWLVL